MRIPITVPAAVRVALDALVPMRSSRRRRLLDQAMPQASVITLSVRSGYAALIEALGMGPGDEIAMSCITIGDMEMLPRAYGIRVVPVAVDPATLAPCPQSLERAIGPRTRMFVAAHLFGARQSLEACHEVADRHGVVLVADAAQAFGSDEHGESRWRVDPHAHVTLLSFGPIKTETALGGGVVACRDAELARRVEAIQRGWSRRSRAAHARRALKYAVLSMLARPRPFAALLAWLDRRSVDADSFVGKFTRGFGQIETPAQLLAAVSLQPDAGLETTIVRRLHARRSRSTRRRAALGSELATALRDCMPAGGSHPHAHWLLPLRCHDEAERRRIRAELIAAGFDAVPIERTNLVDIHVEQGAPASEHALASTLLLPSLHGMRRRDVRRLAHALQCALLPEAPQRARGRSQLLEPATT